MKTKMTMNKLLEGLEQVRLLNYVREAKMPDASEDVTGMNVQTYFGRQKLLFRVVSLHRSNVQLQKLLRRTSLELAFDTPYRLDFELNPLSRADQERDAQLDD